MDNTTKIIVGTISFIILVILLAFIYKAFYETAAKEFITIWPDSISRCPDYWTDLGNGKCKNTFNIGKCPMDNNVLTPNGIIDFGMPPYVNAANPNEANIKKCQKAKACGITWDGLDNLC
jgi:hypothetical protein